MITKMKKVKLKGNESFNIREGWLRKGMRCIEQYPDLFARDDVMELLGVGSKMVKSIRFWMQATKLCEERYINGGNARIQCITDDFGHIINEWDPYFDDRFTLYLLHYQIVANESFCPVWNIFFNEFEGFDFTKDNMIEMCMEVLNKKLEEGVTFSEKSFADDCASIIKMYLNVPSPEDPEESLGCPLSELGLIGNSIRKKDVYNKFAPSQENLDKLAVLYVIIKNLNRDKRSVSINNLLNSPNNIGRVFNLNRVLVNEYLDQLRVSGYLVLNRTAGLDMVYIEKPFTPEDIMIEYYRKAQVR